MTNTGYPHSCRGRKARVRVPVWSSSAESPLPVTDTLLLCGHVWQKAGRVALWGPFYQGTDPIPESSTLLTSQITSQRSYFQYHHTAG